MKNHPNWLNIKECNVVTTFDSSNNENGYLIDILNKSDKLMSERKNEGFQQFYMSTVYEHMFKGFHIHPTKIDTIHCVHGNIILAIYPELISKEDADHAVLDKDKMIYLEIGKNAPRTVSFPSKYPHGFFGIDKLSIVINYRNPAWTPEDTYQYDIHDRSFDSYLIEKFTK